MPYLDKENGPNEPIDCRILTAGMDLFVENGYHNVSIHDIQKRAGVSIGSIYNHFGGKEGVARGLYEFLLGELEKMVDDVVASEVTTEARCRELIRRLFHYTESRRNIIAFVFNAKHREFLTDERSICCSTPFEKMRDIVAQGMEDGTFEQVNPWVAASAVFGGAIRMIQLRLDGLIDQPLPEFVDEVVDTAWNGVKTQGIVALGRASNL